MNDIPSENVIIDKDNNDERHSQGEWINRGVYNLLSMLQMIVTSILLFFTQFYFNKHHNGELLTSNALIKHL